MDVERKLSFLKEAFDDQGFQNELKKIEAEIKGRIKEWLDAIPPFRIRGRFLDPIQPTVNACCLSG